MSGAVSSDARFPLALVCTLVASGLDRPSGHYTLILEKLDPPLAKYSIHRLPFINAEKASALIEAGITTIDAIDDPSVLGKSTRRYLSARAQGVRTVDMDALDQFLSDIVYPVYYFDYETSQSLLPPWDGTRPYQQVPFQYSLHIPREPGGEIEHREYLHRDESNPMPALLERLLEDVGDVGSVLVCYEAFEKTRNDEIRYAYYHVYLRRCQPRWRWVCPDRDQERHLSQTRAHLRPCFSACRP